MKMDHLEYLVYLDRGKNMGFCYKTATVWQMIGKFLFILKILVPIVIIVLGTIDFGKAVLSNDAICVVGSEPAIEKEKELFDTVLPLISC